LPMSFLAWMLTTESAAMLCCIRHVVAMWSTQHVCLVVRALQVMPLTCLTCVLHQLPHALPAHLLQPVNASNVGWYVESRPDVFPYDLWGAMQRARGRPLPTPVPTRFRGPGYGCLPDGSKCCRVNVTTNCPLCPATAGDPSVLWGCNVSQSMCAVKHLCHVSQHTTRPWPGSAM
jgi:hypothetical protein